MSFVDKIMMKTFNLTGQSVVLNVAGIHGTSEINRKPLKVKNAEKYGKVDETIMACSHPNVNSGYRMYNFKNLKEAYLQLSVLKQYTIVLEDVKVILDRDFYHLHRATEHKQCGNATSWAVRTV